MRMGGRIGLGCVLAVSLLVGCDSASKTDTERDSGTVSEAPEDDALCLQITSEAACIAAPGCWPEHASSVSAGVPTPSPS